MSSTSSLDLVKRQFDEWRIQPNKSHKIPDNLWRQVIALLEHGKVSTVLSTLGIRHEQLKRYQHKHSLCVPPQIANSQQFNSPFVNITLPQNSTTKTVDASGLELIRQDGAILRFKKIDAPTLSLLLKSFLG